MKRSTKLLGVLALAALLSLTFAAPARAFDGREGDKVVIKADEVVNDDLYISAGEIIIDGTVNGDLIAFGETVTVNGTVNGDLISAGQTIVVNGEVSDDARIAGAVLFIGEKAQIGSDLVAAGYSLETRPGSVIGQDLVFAGGQALLAGGITRNVKVGTGALELRGSVGGDVEAGVGEGEGNPPMSFPMQSTVPVPVINPGLTIDPSAHIGGNLEYTQVKELTFPSGVVAGKIQQIAPQVEPTIAPPTPAERVSAWGLGMLRDMVTLILIGLFLGWLFPKFAHTLPENLRAKPWASLGWGLVAGATWIFAGLVVLLAMILGAMFFGVFTLHGLSNAVVWVGILSLFALGIGGCLVIIFLTRIIVGEMLGKWILQRTSPNLAEHKFWPMVIGVVVLVFGIGLLKFPLVPMPIGFFGGLAGFATILCGLGALWIWGRERFARKAVISNQ